MVMISAVREYVNRMLRDIPGMKILILDADTVSIVSVVFSQSELLQKEVFLVETIDSISKEVMKHLKAVFFLRPSPENINHIKRHISKPRFGEYHLFFSNILRNHQIQMLGDADEHEVVMQVQAVMNHLNDRSVSDVDCLRLVMLYALRYEKEIPIQLEQLLHKLASRLTGYTPGLVQFLLKQAGVDRRTGDLYGNRDFFNRALNMARGLKGIENVYTQHQPLLYNTMESILKGRLRDVDYPAVATQFQQGRPQDVIIFIIGGTTYEEARTVALHNSTNSGTRIILGGSAVLNSKRFLKDLEEAHHITRTNSF